jgi:hypothetical protein
MFIQSFSSIETSVSIVALLRTRNNVALHRNVFQLLRTYIHTDTHSLLYIRIFNDAFSISSYIAPNGTISER